MKGDAWLDLAKYSLMVFLDEAYVFRRTASSSLPILYMNR